MKKKQKCIKRSKKKKKLHSRNWCANLSEDKNETTKNEQGRYSKKIWKQSVFLISIK